ncbi:MAG TPA: beta-eliminating lyase-related protein, partial [Roseiarcus sp.]|nr:beta-eliminating lyase-related protein [Roseiarcus sp.]
GAGAAPEILEALVAASRGVAAAYGADEQTKAAEARLCEVFERDAAVFLVATGTGANALALGALASPWSAVFCHEESHIHDDECGAPEFFTGGAKLVGIPGEGGKITPATLKETLARFPRGLVKSVQPGALSLSQATEAGTIYSLDEIAALTDLSRSHGLATHMDGARFANSLVALGCAPADMSWRAGIDVLSFGATKNGALACEAVIFFDRGKAEAFAFQRKRGGHTLSKGRFLGAQMNAYLKDDLWLALARRANRAAERLARGLAALPGVRLAWPAQINEVFAIAPRAVVAPLQAAGARLYEWTSRAVALERAPRPGEAFLRLVCSFETSDAEIDQLTSIVKAHCGEP